MLAASLTEKALGSRVDVTSDNPVTKLGPSSVSSNSASDYRITIDSARKALKKGSVAFDGGVEIDKLRKITKVKYNKQFLKLKKKIKKTKKTYKKILIEKDLELKINTLYKKIKIKYKL